MALITLTSDFGHADPYLSGVKGAIYQQLPVVQLVDISHEIEKHDIAQAAFIAKQAYQNFPEGTIHIIGVKPHANQSIEHVAIDYKGHYFIGADNGMFSLIFDEPPTKVISIALQDTGLINFPVRDVFAKAACHLARGGTIDLLGRPKEGILQMMVFEPIVQPSGIRGHIQYIDSYGNLITNVSYTLFQQVAQSREVAVSLRGARHEVRGLSANASHVPEGELAAYFGNSNFLELGINAGSASQLLGIRVNDSVMINFEDFL